MKNTRKKCSSCGRKKNKSSFHKRHNTPDKLCYKCKECQRSYQKALYKENPAKYKAYTKAYIHKVRDYVRKVKSGPCVDCGQTFHYCVMDFDHVRGKKSFGLATVSYACRSIEIVMREIAKCDLVCSNCHRIRSFKRMFPVK